MVDQPEQFHPIALIGLPIDAHSSFLRGCALGPAAIRSALRAESSNSYAENGVDTARDGLVLDLGDLPVGNRGDDHRLIQGAAAEQYRQRRKVIALGGDHAVTFPLVAAMAGFHPGASLLHFDAHPDLYESFDGDPLSHASPFARIMENGLVVNLVQVGIRTLNPHQRAQAERFGVHQFSARNFAGAIERLGVGPTYISIDLDGLDPAYAPGVSHHEPGGLTVREVLDLIDAVPGPIVGADVVELNPTRDINGMTAMVAAKLVKELIGRMATA